MKTKYLSIAIPVLALLMSGCSSDKLHQNPATSLSDETVLETSETVQAVLMGAYRQTERYIPHTMSQTILEVMGNDFMITNGTFGFSTYNWFQFAYDYTQYPRVVDGWWSCYAPYIWRYTYMAIDRANGLIYNADKLPPGCEDYLAQAYAVRGYNFLNLFHLFCGSYTGQGEAGQGLFLRTMPGTSDGNDVPRSNLGDSFKQIISDFKYAYENIRNTDVYFFNKKAVTMLLARTYLVMGDYANAQKYAEELSSFDGKDLMSQKEYQAGFNKPNDEWLMGFNFNSETGNIYASMPSFWWDAKQKDKASGFGTEGYGTQTDYSYIEENGVDVLEGYSTVRAAFSFTSLFGKGDCRALFPFYIDKRDGMFIAKFSSIGGALGVADYPVARYAEAYLVEAECLSRNGNPARALEVLNVLQEKRGGTLSTEASVDEVWKERRRELYGEGFSLPDIKRLQKPLERTGDDQWSSVKTLPANSPRMMLPIPGDELDYNKVATQADQNEYWR